MTTLQNLDDKTLLTTLHDLVGREREATADLVACLAEVDRRKIYADRGYSSMFAYCRDALHMAEPSIYVRIQVARCVVRFPAVLDMLRRGELHLSAVKLLAPHLTGENFQTLCGAARHASKRAVEEMVRDLVPKPSVKDALRQLPGIRACHPYAVQTCEANWKARNRTDFSGAPTPPNIRCRGRPNTVPAAIAAAAAPPSPGFDRCSCDQSDGAGNINSVSTGIPHSLPDGAPPGTAGSKAIQGAVHCPRRLEPEDQTRPRPHLAQEPRR